MPARISPAATLVGGNFLKPGGAEISAQGSSVTEAPLQAIVRIEHDGPEGDGVVHSLEHWPPRIERVIAVTAATGLVQSVVIGRKNLAGHDDPCREHAATCRRTVA